MQAKEQVTSERLFVFLNHPDKLVLIFNCQIGLQARHDSFHVNNKQNN